MNKDKKLAPSEAEGLIPELRFPDFENDGEWSEKKLGTIAKKIVKKNKNGLINNVFTNSAIEGIVDQREYFDKDIADKNNLENYYIVEDGDYVYNPRISNIAPVGPISKNKTGKTGAMSPLYTVFRFTDKNNGFYEYYFNSVHWYGSIRKASNTGARFDRMSITDSAFMDIPVLYPKPTEQQKIASCLSSLDEVIAAHSQKLELLKDHKKGLMQNLFPQEGEKVPKFRFKEFENDGEWVEKKLEELGDFKNGINFLPEQRGSGVLTIDVLNMFGKGIEVKFDSLYRVETNVGDYLLEEGDILFVRSSVKKEGVGWASLFNGFSEPVIYCGFLIRFRIQSFQSITPEFLLYYLRSEITRKKIISLAGMAAITNISQDSLKSVSVNIPAIQEQQKIASCLSSLDALIAAQAEKIEQLKLHKKGLMQGLFPKINE